ncbi:MAG TPA: hypothetical protein VGR91_04935 [Stellaceae bacterium]|nr:hypothetical protein [Stellaceae bacterium]
MKKTLVRLYALGAAVAVSCGLAGLALAQGAPAASGAGGPPPGYDQGGGTPEEPAMPGAPEAAAAPELPVLYVTGVEVVKTSLNPATYVIWARGLTGSSGWSAPELVPVAVGKPLDGILDLQFIATTPLQSQPATGFVPIGAMFQLEANSPYKGVRIRAAGNAVELDKMPGVARASLKTVEDCRGNRCIGKRFAEKGKAPPNTPGTVRAEDLPYHFRVIYPQHGIAGITHNPNRLNLILGKDGRVVSAFWE